jgi:hypothetical protein
MEQNLCQLDAAAGRHAQCPGDECALWRDGECTIAPLRADLATNACLVTYLVGLRSSLERTRPPDPLREFHPPGLA